MPILVRVSFAALRSARAGFGYPRLEAVDNETVIASSGPFQLSHGAAR